MRMSRLLSTLILVAAACGSDPKTQPDAQDITPDAPSMLCPALEAPAMTLSTYPATFDGTVKGAGADLSVATGICTTQVGDFWFEPVGEDVVVKLTGLTVGTSYGISLDTTEDLSFYVMNGCTATAGGPVAGQCDLFADASLKKEQGAFVATAAEEYLVIDTANDPMPPATGAFSLKVVQAQCTDDTMCSGATPACESFACTECHDSFGCTAAATAVCSADHTCGAGSTTCTGDDVRDNGAGDDGPASATMLALPTASTPTTISSAVCSSPATEADFFKIVVPVDLSLGFQLNFAGVTNDLDVIVYDSSGTAVAAGVNDPGVTEQFTADLTPDTYYIKVMKFAPANAAAAVAYTLAINQVECRDEFGCTTAGTPTCSAVGRCVAGPALCVGDDAGDNAGGDDGPAGARNLTAGVGVASALTGSICNSPSNERDYYKFTVLQGQGLDISLAWATADDLDIAVFDVTGNRLGVSYYKTPEAVQIRYLPAGTYFLQVTLFAQAASTAVTAYTITATRTAAQTCTTSTDCAGTFSTQIYRGSCTAGACQFIPSGARAAGMPCDSGDDCASTSCSYIPFESDAQKSVCTGECTTTADCAAIGAGLTCSAGLQQNFCVPSCASDLECGADQGNATLTTGQPWAYFTCATATGVCTL